MVIGVPQTYEYLTECRTEWCSLSPRIRIYPRNASGTYAKDRRAGNDVGTILFGEEAVKYGLIDEMGGLKEALKKLYELIAKRKKNKNSISQGLYKAGGIAMILYSIVPPEIVFGNFDWCENQKQNYIEVDYCGEKVVVMPLSNNRYMISRLSALHQKLF